jgi:hypothetical protein
VLASRRGASTPNRGKLPGKALIERSLTRIKPYADGTDSHRDIRTGRLASPRTVRVTLPNIHWLK